MGSTDITMVYHGSNLMVLVCQDQGTLRFTSYHETVKSLELLP